MLSVDRKITKLIARYEKFVKYPNGTAALTEFDNIFDITSAKGSWRSTEDETFYNIQCEVQTIKNFRPFCWHS